MQFLKIVVQLQLSQFFVLGVCKFIYGSKLWIQKEQMGKETFTLGPFGFKTRVLTGLDPIKCEWVCLAE